jgi:hypothetical protein
MRNIKSFPGSCNSFKGKRMTEIGTSVAKQIRSQYPGLTTHKEKVEKLAE